MRGQRGNVFDGVFHIFRVCTKKPENGKQEEECHYSPGIHRGVGRLMTAGRVRFEASKTIGEMMGPIFTVVFFPRVIFETDHVENDYISSFFPHSRNVSHGLI